ncbi:cell division protein FtsB [Neisseria sp.]|mgnify:FL=1|uniref:cell division protein FtsB n=1 Tax=Neisseria sp. TaxID=192066 RepID=UPI00289999BA|nr:cell division protein FtsB [Neisseria sp.]
MKWVTVFLTCCILGSQYHLWFAKGGWHDMWRLENEVTAQETENNMLILRNNALSAEVKDLAEGKDAIAEIARVDLGYIQDGEIYYRMVDARRGN